MTVASMVLEIYVNLQHLHTVSLRDRSYREQQREREDQYRRETDRDRDRPSSRVDRPQSRSGQYHYDRDRPSSRAEGYGRDDLYRRNRAYYRDYGDLSYDERYDRPRSRQGELLHIWEAINYEKDEHVPYEVNG